MASSWSNKLETRLSTLADGASAESTQSLAQWIGFNRKHSKAFCTTLNKHFQEDSAARQWIYLQIVHGVLLLEKDNPTKWDRLSDTRTLLGESVVLPALQRSNAAMKERVAPMIDEWDDVNAFGTTTLVNRMRKLLSSEVKEEEVTVDSKPADAHVQPPKEEPKSEPVQEVKDAAVKQEEDVKMKEEQETPDTTPSKLSLKRASSVEEVTFDFEGSGIPYSKVESHEFMEPCKSIATLQVARDLRNDSAVQLSSRLSALPEEIKAFCREAQEKQQEDSNTLELSDEQAIKFAELIGDDLLDTDMDEALLNVKTFMGIVEQQKQARRQLIQLLIQSRCQFGADEAAKVFHSLDDIIDNLKERKQLLSDAMDVEGLDFETSDSEETDKSKQAAALEPLTWYIPDKPDSKRAKLE